MPLSNVTNAKYSDDNELIVSETERESDCFSQYTTTYSATTYVILVSKDNPLFPHKRQGQSGNRIDITSAYYAADLAANTSSSFSIGVITRIDGTNADIKYCIGIPFLAGASKSVILESLRGVPSQVKTDFSEDGTLLHGITNLSEDDVAAVNTVTTLASPAGNIMPGLGDIILKYTHSSGSCTFGIFLFYHNTD